MRLIEWSQFLEEGLFPGSSAAVTVGVFDGVHLGHKVIIERIVSRRDAAPVIVTFRRSPQKKRGPYAGDILSFRQKTAIFKSLGAAAVIVVDFSESFGRMSGTDFLTVLRKQGGMVFLAVGGNFRCGWRRDTDARKITEFNALNGILTDIVEPLTEGGEPVSSSRIRDAVTRGDLTAASAMLGRPFTADLDGALPLNSYGGAAYDTAGLGRVLPPRGRYSAFLLDKDGARLTGKPAEIIVEKETLTISGNKFSSGAEYLEFLS